MKFKKILFISISLCLSTSLWANTFVGNGGNAGDVELEVTKRQIRTTLESLIQRDSQKSLCECSSVFANHKECRPLRELEESQKNYCSQKIQESLPQLLELLQKSSPVTYHWINENIVINEHGQRILVDAVSNPEKMSITLNQKRFKTMPASQRLFLLSHELLHLIKIDGDKISDTGPIGTFAGKQGKRKLLNAMSSALVMQAQSYDKFYELSQPLKRQQSYKLNWLSLSLGAGKSLNPNNANYALPDPRQFSFVFTHYFKNNLGFHAGYKRHQSNEKRLTTVDLKNTMQGPALGLSYRFFPFKDPLTALGQSFVELKGSYEMLFSKYSISDSYVAADFKETGWGWSLESLFHYPTTHFWIHAGLGLNQQNIDHKDLNFKSNYINLSAKIGVSYGF